MSLIKYIPIGMIAAVTLGVTIGLAQVQKTTPVLVSFPAGHGTGTYIGNGRILTAAHVVGENTEVQIRTSYGENLIGKVVWTAPHEDVAMVQITPNPVWEVAKINCISPPVGTHVNAVGYAYSVGPVQTWGRIASEKRDLTNPLVEDFLWPEILMGDVTVAPGMSGGPVFDNENKIRATVVGVTNHGLSILVPSNVICRLMVENSRD